MWSPSAPSLLPTPRLAAVVAFAGAGFLVGVEVGLALNLLLLAVVVREGWVLVRMPVPEVVRRVPGRVDLGDEGIVEVEMGFEGASAARALRAFPGPVTLWWTDDPGEGITRWPEEGIRVELPTEPGAPPAHSTSRVRGVRRGHTSLGAIHLRVAGPLDLLRRQLRLELEDPISVQPGLRALRHARTPGLHVLREYGAHRLRSREGGREFAQLREYVRGDDPRRIDWKATARRGEVIVREYEAERSQNLVLAIDAGRLMTERFEGRERLDHALGSALVLADAARTHGDSVGILLFADTVQAWLPPGRHPLSKMADVLASVQSRRVEPDYPAAFGALGRRLRRRSLVVLYTDVVDPRTSGTLLAHLAASARRHLPLLVAIRNVQLEAVAAAPPSNGEDVYRKAAAEELLQERAIALNGVRRRGVLVADVRPDAVLPEVLARYTEVKRRGLL